MELKDTVDLMISDDYKERFRAEYYQTKDRYNKLSETNKLLTKFGICIVVFIIFCLIFICCA